jgi:UDP-GlcNAc:undecaprenyl-phosphate GlcNAc-1-phosphate transferase
MNYFIPFLAAFLVSMSLTYLSKEIGYRFSLLSEPRSRDVHKKPIPRIGGLAIFLSFFIVSTVVFFVYPKDLTFGFGQFLGYDKRLIGILLGGAFVAFSMFFDDIKGLAAWKKLILQTVVALIVISFGIGIDYLANPFGERINLNTVYIPLFSLNGTVYHFSLLSDLLTLVWIVGMMNIINFVDGVDGLASGLSTIASVTIFLLSVSIIVNQPATATIAIILASSSLGFLVWNFPPAKIFMGDSGSMFLGFMLGVLPLISGGKLATVFLVLGFPIVDGVLVALGRLVKGKNPLTTPDKTHLHHRLLYAGFTPRQAILLIYGISIAFGWVALRSTTLTKIIASLVLFVLISLFIILLATVRGKKPFNNN